MQIQFEVFDESIVEVLTGQAGQLVRLPELGSRLTVGETGVVRLNLFLSIHDSNISLVAGRSSSTGNWRTDSL